MPQAKAKAKAAKGTAVVVGTVMAMMTTTNTAVEIIQKFNFEGVNLPEFSSFCSNMMTDKKIATVTSILVDKSDNWGGSLLLYGVS